MIRYNYHVTALTPRRHVIARIEATEERAVINIGTMTEGAVPGLGPAPRMAEIITKPMPPKVAYTLCAIIERFGLPAALRSESAGPLFTVGF